MYMNKYPCVYMRGGTSKAVIFHKKDLPEDERLWEEIFLKVMGTPDVKQIDGMGGTVSSTSKIAVISPSTRDNIDVDYHFFQVNIDVPKVDSNINCGNISSAVGPFAIDEGLVPAVEPITVVRVYNINTGKVIEEHVRVENGHAMVHGDTAIKGVPGTGSRIDLLFEKPGGAATGKLFPTGKRKEVFNIPDYGPVEVTLIDCANPFVLVRAEDIGLTGAELIELNGNASAMEHLERIRGMAAVKLGLVQNLMEARTVSATAPKISILSAPRDYMDLDGNNVPAETMDLCCRALSLGSMHKAYPMTQAIATAAAVRIEGTIANEIVHPAPGQEEIRLGHASGVTEVVVKMKGEEVRLAGIVRTARRIMDGYVYVRE